MYYKCCIDNCASKRQDVKLHKFPSSEIGLHKWLECINSDRLNLLSIQDVRKLLVCHKHFEPRFITEKSRIRLGAYPTLFSEEEIEKRIPTAIYEPENLAVNVAFDHCYYDKRLRRETHEDHTYSKPTSSVLLNSADPTVDQDPIVSETVALQLPTTSGLQPVLREAQIRPQVSSMPDTPLEKRLPLREIQNIPQSQTLTGNKPCAAKRKRTRASAARRRRRLVARAADLPPEYRRIYDEYRKSVKQIDVLRRTERAKAFRKTDLFDKLTSKVNPLAKQIMWLQDAYS